MLGGAEVVEKQTKKSLWLEFFLGEITFALLAPFYVAFSGFPNISGVNPLCEREQQIP